MIRFQSEEKKRKREQNAYLKICSSLKICIIESKMFCAGLFVVRPVFQDANYEIIQLSHFGCYKPEFTQFLNMNIQELIGPIKYNDDCFVCVYMLEISLPLSESICIH